MEKVVGIEEIWVELLICHIGSSIFWKKTLEFRKKYVLMQVPRTSGKNFEVLSGLLDFYFFPQKKLRYFDFFWKNQNWMPMLKGLRENHLDKAEGAHSAHFWNFSLRLISPFSCIIAKWALLVKIALYFSLQTWT